MLGKNTKPRQMQDEYIDISSRTSKQKETKKAKEIKGDWTLRVGREDGSGRYPEVGFHLL